jgi:large subunit ribosomal protein L29
MAASDMIKAEEIREKNDTDIHGMLDNYRKEMFNLRLQLATRKQKNHQRVKLVRRQIARLQTVLREREIEALYAAEIAELQALVSTGADVTNG